MNAWIKRQPAPIQAAVVLALWMCPYLMVAAIENWGMVRAWLGL